MCSVHPNELWWLLDSDWLRYYYSHLLLFIKLIAAIGQLLLSPLFNQWFCLQIPNWMLCCAELSTHTVANTLSSSQMYMNDANSRNTKKQTNSTLTHVHSAHMCQHVEYYKSLRPCVDAFFFLFNNNKMNGTAFFSSHLQSFTRARGEKSGSTFDTPHIVCLYCYLINNVYNLTVYWSLLMQNMVHFFSCCFVAVVKMHGRCYSQPGLLNRRQYV